MGDESMTEPNDLTNADSKDSTGNLSTLNRGVAIENVINNQEGALPNGENDNSEEFRGQVPLSQQEKSDSEAETVVLPDKNQTQGPNETKAIKLEDDGAESEVIEHGKESRKLHESNQRQADGSRRQPLKRKRGREEPESERHHDERSSSDLSSNGSSPPPQARSSKTSESRSDDSRSPPPHHDEDDGDGRLHKRTATNDNKPNKRRASLRAPTDELKRFQGHRLDRSSNAHQQHARRSESPHSHPKNRVRSTQPNGSTHGVNKRRQPPAPLKVDRRRRTPEDAPLDSDDSSSAQSHYPAQRMASGDGHAMSPAKFSHKKNRDRSGRTLLSRAAAGGAYDETQRWLKERPSDINVPDYAGNTPLQIASLNGMDAIVDLLIKEGCDITCKNGDGDTPLIDAIENSHLGVVNLLLKAGVDQRQRNEKGEAPIELVDLEDDSGEAIRDALLEAKNRIDATRRQSEDQRHHTRDPDTPSAQASAASPSESTRSPPPVLDKGGRKRTARSHQTDEALLWVSATPERLTQEAGKGNLKFVGHILGMKPIAHTDAVIAAVKGGHHEVLGYMIALGSPPPDPSPLAGQQVGQNTPMLAAIGRGNLEVIKLLLDQAGFDPNRRIYKDMTYPDIATERKGDNWEEERDLLQNAIDEHRRTGGRRSNTTSPRRVRKQKPAPKDEDTEPPSSPQEVRKVRKSLPQSKDQSDPEIRKRPSYHGTAAKQHKSVDQDASLGTLDRPHSRPGSAKSRSVDRPGSAGHDSALGPPRPDSVKPRRKLISANDLKTGQDAKRRSKVVGDEDVDSAEPRRKLQHRQSFSIQTGHRPSIEETTLASTKVKKASSEEPARSKEESDKKRMRVSASPQTNKSDPAEHVNKNKRQKIGSPETVTDSSTKVTTEPMVANMVSSSPTAITSPGQGAAPVAFMGASTATPAALSLREPPASRTSSTLTDVKMDSAPSETKKGQSKQSDDPHSPPVEPLDAQKIEEQRAAAERAQKEEQDRQKALQREKEKVKHQERMKREEEAARLDSQRRAEAAERQAQLERDAEEARIAKAKKDQEIQRRLLEEERRRKEEQERKRKEREEREALRRLKLQEDERRAKLEALPNGLRRAAELDPEKAREHNEIKRWLPLRTVTTKDLDPAFVGEGADDQWLANIQAAPLLANQDLGLSQYTAWSRSPANPTHVNHLWRQLRNTMSQTPTTAYIDFKMANELDTETKPKFFQLNVFWIKLSDFMDIVPRHAHLAGLKLSTRIRPMALKDPASFSNPSTPQSAHSSGERGETSLVNGIITNGEAQGKTNT